MAEKEDKKETGMSTVGLEIKLPYLATWNQKKATDFKLAKQMFDHYDIIVGEPSPSRIQRIDENYDLYNGRWPSMEHHNADLNFTAGMEKISLSGAKLRHYPYIDSIARAIVSEVGLRPITPIVIDTSSRGTSERKRFKQELVGNYLNETFFQPMREKITQEYLMEMGVTDPMQLDAEQQQQAMVDIEQRIEASTPQDMIDYLESYILPEEKMGQIFINYLMKEAEMRRKFTEGFRDGVIVGEEYHLIRILNGKPVHERLNPKRVVYGMSQDDIFVEDGEWAKYTQYTRFSKILEKYGGSLKESEVRRLADLCTPLSGYRRDVEDSTEIDRKILKDVMDGVIDQTDINYKTREGQEKLKALYQAYDVSSGDGLGIKEVYVTWKWNRRIKEVKRIVNGKIEKFYFDEAYEVSELKGDLESRTIFVPQTWHGVKLADDIYVNLEPVPYQYNNLDNPFQTKLTIHGAAYNRLGGNSKNLGLLDRAKPWQYRFNVQMRRIEEYEATNVGKVLLGTANMKPHDWTWQQFFMAMRYGKFVPTNTHGEHVNAIDAQFFKSIDLSNITDVSHALEQLEYTERKMANAMYYNMTKLGSISPYMTTGNSQQNVEAADKQLYEYYRMHADIRDRVLQTMMNTARVAYKDGGLITSTLLDDFSRAGLEIQEYDESFESLALFVRDDYKEYQKMQVIKQTVSDFIMKGLGTLEDFIKVLDAESINDIKMIAQSVTRRRRDEQRQAQQSQQEAIAAQKELEEQMMKLKHELDMIMKREEFEFRLQQTEIDAMKFANQYDIDGDKQNDLMQMKQMEIAAEERMNREKLDIEKYKVDERVRLEREKIGQEKSKS